MDFSKIACLPGDPSQTNRPIRLFLKYGIKATDTALLVARVEGKESICGGIDYRLQCLSTCATLPLKDFMALPAELRFVTDRGELHAVSGIVAQASAGASDGGLATYDLVLRDAFSLMEQRVNTRVFRGVSEVDIAVALMRGWRQSNSVLAETLDIDTSGIRREYAKREFVMQYNESDAALLRRLLKRRGISWYIRPGPINRTPGGAIAIHTIVLFDTPDAIDKSSAGTIRFHREAGTEARDSIVRWSAVRNLKVGSLARQSWDYRQNRMASTHAPTVLKQGATGDRFARGVQDYRVEPPHRGDDDSDYRLLGDVCIQRLEYEAKCFHAESGVRDLRAGQWFTLEGHPEIDLHPDGEREFVVTELEFSAESNLPSSIHERACKLFATNAWREPMHVDLGHAARQPGARFANRFVCVRRGIAIVPSFDPDHDLPRVRLQSAIVVGPPGEEVHCDRMGRVKLRFPGMREQDHPDGLGASNSERDSAWVRVATHWAGSGSGGVTLPRVGDEVLVDFLGGDPDRPIVVGCVYGGRAAPPAFSHLGMLPDNRFVAGIKSREIKGKRYNQLRLDDTTGEISAQLASEHGHSQLNLGWLSQPRNSGKGEARGEGAELRSDKSVVVRAAHLMLLTTQAMLGAAGKLLEREPLLALLESSQALLKEFGEFAGQHQGVAPELEALGKLVKDLQHADQGSDAVTQGGKPAPLMAQYAEGGLVQATPGSSIVHSGHQHNIVANQHIQAFAGQGVNINAGKNISLFAQKEGIRHIARAGRVDMQAQQDSIGIAADQDVKITASKGDIVIAAKKSLTLWCDGAYIKIVGGKIEHGCAGDFTVKASQHLFEGAARQDNALPFFPSGEHTNWLKLDLDGFEGAPMADVPYTLHMAGGLERQGTLDANGFAEERNLPDSVTKVVYHNSPSAKDEPRPTVSELMDKIDSLVGAASMGDSPVDAVENK